MCVCCFVAQLVGGLDVLTELQESGELQSMLEQPPPLEAKEPAAEETAHKQ